MRLPPSCKLAGVIFGLLLSCLAAPAWAGTDYPFVNPGFEDGLLGWSFWQDNGMSKAIPDAAHSGKLGLRVTDNSTTNGCSIENRRFPAAPGKTYELKFWTRTLIGEGGGAHLRFFDANDKVLASQSVGSASPDWTQVSLKLKAPAEAVQIGIWIHTGNAAITLTDFDDFTLTQLD